MKHKLETMLKNKLQWLLLLAALLGVSQGVWGATYPANTPVYVRSTTNYSEVAIHVWGGSASTSWPGQKMNYVGNSGSYYYWTYTFTGTFTNMIVTQNNNNKISGSADGSVGSGNCINVTGSSYSWTTYTPPCTTPTASNFTIGTSEYTYDGSSKPVSVTAKYGSPTITVYYTGINGTSYTKSTTAPSAVGRYKVTVNTTAVSTYCAVSDLEVATLKIKKTVTVRVKKEGDYASTTPYLYSWYGTDETKGSGNWPGSAMTLDGTSYKYQITIDAPTYNIIVSKNGSDQTSDIKGLTGDVCYSITSKTATAATATKPTVTTTAAASITTNTATLGGNVTDAGQTATCGTQTVSARGIEWVSGTGKTEGNKEAASAGGTGTFTVDVTGLSSNTTYTYKAYATNGKGTSYGSEQSFKTEATTCTRPTMVISAKTAETNSFTFKVKASDLGDCTISSWGVKAWTSSSCEGAADFTQAGTGTLTTSDQLVTISGLDANTTYYFKSYAALSPSGEALSSKNTKTTLIDPPSTASSSVTSSTTATLTADAYSTGGGVTTTLSAAGFIYSQTKSYIDSNTEASATIANSSVKTVGATYSTEITDLEPNKTYYYKPRIYYSVTNNQSSFTGYGSTTYSFKTNNVFGTVSINNNGVSSVCLGSGTVTWNASASSGSPTSWTVNSSNTNVATATINSSGVITITPKAAGSTTITATAKRAGYDDKTSDGVTITINAIPTITLTGVGGKSASATYPWDYMTITATTTPADLVVNWTKLYSGSGSEPVNSVTKSASPSHTYKIKSAITSNPNSDKYTIKANGTSSGCAAIEAVYDVYINNPDGEICD